MAEIPAGEYSHIHRSIEQLRSMNERGVLGQLGSLSATDIRASLVHDYKQFNISDLRNNERLEYAPKNNGGIDMRGGDGNGNNNNNNQTDDLRHQEQQQDQKPYSSPSTPPTPLSIADGQMNESKVCHWEIYVLRRKVVGIFCHTVMVVKHCVIVSWKNDSEYVSHVRSATFAHFTKHFSIEVHTSCTFCVVPPVCNYECR